MRRLLAFQLFAFALCASAACVSKDDGSDFQVAPDSGLAPSPDATPEPPPPPPPTPEPTYNHYWILGQNPAETDIYLYAKDGATISFDGTIASPTLVNLAADQFTQLNAGTLGYAQTGGEWYFLELFSDKDVMVSFDRSVEIQTGASTFETQHGDSIHNKPPRELSTHLYFALGGSGPQDDILNAYAQQETTMTVKAISNTGMVVTRTETFQGLFTSTRMSTWMSGITSGYSLEIQADHPIAAAVFDELPRYPNIYNGSGYYFGSTGQSELYTEYLQIRQDYDQYATVYMPSATDFSFLDSQGTQVGNTFQFAAQAGTFIRDNEVGFTAEDHPVPYLVKLTGDMPFAERAQTPSATDVRDSAAFMGWNTTLANLEIFTEQSNTVRIYDGRTMSLVATWNLEADTAVVANAVDIGFPADEPFLALVVADQPIYQEIRNSRYLRQYPGALGPVID